MKKIILLVFCLLGCASTTEWIKIDSTSLTDAISKSNTMQINELLIPLSCSVAEYELEREGGSYKLTPHCEVDMMTIGKEDICLQGKPVPSNTEGFCLVSW